MNEKLIRLLVVDDHILFLRGLVEIISYMPEFVVVGQAKDGQEALRKNCECKPDVVLLDVNMPVMGGIDTVKALRKLEHPPKIIMLTISQKDDDLFGAINAGADGYLLKNTEPDDLHRALLQLTRGGGILSPEVTGTVMKTISRLQKYEIPSDMSPRELDVLNCLATGQTTRDISDTLVISENTVKTHIRHIMEKLDASNRTEAVSKALQMGMIRRSR